MKRLISTIFTLVFVITTVFSQITVTSFEELPFDLDASISKKRDWSGKPCAIIKVFTTYKGFSFDNGMLGIVDVEYDEAKHPAEIWVYVPETTMKLKISHAQYGHIQNSQQNDGFYWFQRVKGGKSYKMDLAINVPQPPEPQKKQAGWLILTSEPDSAEVYLWKEGEKEEYQGTTPFKRKLPYDRYYFRLKKDKYYGDMGIADIKQTKLEIPVKLKPACGTVKVTSVPSGAKIYLDGTYTGYSTPCDLTEVASGTHEIRLQKENYTPQTQSVTIGDGETLSVSTTLEARFAQVTINAPAGATVKVNGEEKGQGTQVVSMPEGLYDIEVTLGGHRAATKQLEVVSTKAMTIELTPTPMYGSLDVDADQMGATITIAGKNYGTTPNSIDKLLCGEYDVKISKAGYLTVTERVTIAENKTSSVNVKMQAGEDAPETPVEQNTPQQAQTNPANPLTPRWAGSVTPSQKAVLERLIANMVKIEGGTFTMGATPEQGKDANKNEKPAHQVTLSSYYIGKYEVTQEEWQAVMGSNPSYFKGSNYPVEVVSWKDCQKFIENLNYLTGLRFSLPTEAQWEYAARGGKHSKGYKYAGSNNIEDVAWYDDNGGGTTHLVGMKKPNELGLYDMSGNVWEWCSDKYGKNYYKELTTYIDPMGSTKGSDRVRRGGSWNAAARGAAACRAVTATRPTAASTASACVWLWHLRENKNLL